MKIQYFARFALMVIAVTAMAFAQFAKVDVSFDDRLLRDAERQQLLPLKDEITRFFANTKWDDDYSDLEISLNIQIVFEGSSSKGAVETFLAQALFSNGSDQRYFDKGFLFYFSESAALFYDPVLFDPMASFLAYYANLILAAEVDTYEPKGGSRFYEIARAIALRGTQSEFPRGWAERVNIENLLSTNHGLRKARFATLYGIEAFEYGELKEAIEQFKKMITGLEEAHRKSPRERYTMLFLDGHAERLTEILSILRQEEILNDLILLDPDNEEIYERGLETKFE